MILADTEHGEWYFLWVDGPDGQEWMLARRVSRWPDGFFLPDANETVPLVEAPPDRLGSLRGKWDIIAIEVLPWPPGLATVRDPAERGFDWKPGMLATNGARFSSWEVVDGRRTGGMYWSRPGAEGGGCFHCWPGDVKDWKPDRRDAVTAAYMRSRHGRGRPSSIPDTGGEGSPTAGNGGSSGSG